MRNGVVSVFSLISSQNRFEKQTCSNCCRIFSSLNTPDQFIDFKKQRDRTIAKDTDA